VLLAGSFSGIIGIFFGFYPARQAVQLYTSLVLCITAPLQQCGSGDTAAASPSKTTSRAVVFSATAQKEQQEFFGGIADFLLFFDFFFL
jgi:hypothetical protein